MSVSTGKNLTHLGHSERSEESCSDFCFANCPEQGEIPRYARNDSDAAFFSTVSIHYIIPVC
jgi:hypothetical protein